MRCSWRPIGHTLLSGTESREKVSSLLHGEMSLRRRGSRGLSSPRLINDSCGRSACDEHMQVLRVCFQGNADEDSGRSSHSSPP